VSATNDYALIPHLTMRVQTTELFIITETVKGSGIAALNCKTTSISG